MSFTYDPFLVQGVHHANQCASSCRSLVQIKAVPCASCRSQVQGAPKLQCSKTVHLVSGEPKARVIVTFVNHALLWLKDKCITETSNLECTQILYRAYSLPAAEGMDAARGGLCHLGQCAAGTPANTSHPHVREHVGDIMQEAMHTKL
eukprot:1146910-Pelagomonas_calceolata.AAC.5